MFKIVDYHIAKKIQPLLKMTIQMISKIMENPEDFLFHGYWTIPVECPIPEMSAEQEALINSLTPEEEECYSAWLKSWLNSHGWDITDDMEKIIPFTPATNAPLATTGENQ